MKNAINFEPTSSEQPIRLTKRGKKVGGVALALALAVGGGMALNPIKDTLERGGHAYTKDELDHMPQASVVVQPGEGSNAIVRESQPGLVDPQAFADVSDYVRNEGTVIHDGYNELRSYQVVSVPIIPGLSDK